MRREPGSVAVGEGLGAPPEPATDLGLRPAEHQRQGVEEQRQPEVGDHLAPAAGDRRGEQLVGPGPDGVGVTGDGGTGEVGVHETAVGRVHRRVGLDRELGRRADVVLGRDRHPEGRGRRERLVLAADPAHVTVAQEHRVLGAVDCRVQPTDRLAHRTERVVRVERFGGPGAHPFVAPAVRPWMNWRLRAR